MRRDSFTSSFLVRMPFLCSLKVEPVGPAASFVLEHGVGGGSDISRAPEDSKVLSS